MKRFLSTLSIGVVASLGLSDAFAADTGHYAEREAGRALIEQLYTEHDVPRATTRKLLEQAQYKQDIIDKMTRPAEKTMTWGRYRQIFVEPERARQGAAYMAEHRALFEAAEKRYGVPAYIVAAILGVETRYGRFIGRDRVIDALSTLAFDYPPRSEFFTKELGSFVRLCVAEKLDCTHDVGSYAGAMGLGQFMPSSYAAYAVDGNNDGKRDLWDQPADIIYSVANYLAENGWQRGAPIAQPATLARPDLIEDITPSTRHTKYRWGELARMGVSAEDSPTQDTQVGLLSFVGPHDQPEYWIAEHNFFVITTYNTSPLYAMAVYQLGRMIHSFDDGGEPGA
ncbi:lytic murein transglycosylase B [uncultured Salinisphaera sp.]|uniref:lytic murein transglycosylase B n=1 Tax=uncultured Salinisphaera sp. TaxID=359372 RepID=UPI0032B11828|tara:strand:+ start:2383 stop:3402 length:1020 start_codon:yes stop_codon:yes gene_type:complete